MANFLSNIRNPIDDDTREELIEVILGFSTYDIEELEGMEHWQLEQFVRHWREEQAAEDHFASFYSY